ncbi:MAG TPA: hypothetical protein VOA80_16385 [Thermoanaerobaculia bacterium]|nr:hypothetical protein [Thermoanaerobaculia bacterium]
MRSSQQSAAPPLGNLPHISTGSGRISIPLHRVLGFARQESDSRPSRQLAFALRPLLGLALATTGLCPESPAVSPLRRALPPSGSEMDADAEILFSALSSLVEVVKILTPGAGKVYALLGHEAVPAPDGPDGGDHDRGQRGAATAPRSEVVIELRSTAGGAYASLPPAVLDDFGSLAFELAVVAAVVESKGGELDFGSPHGDTRSFVVRLPVCRC